jgi:thiamine kinase-like enzyme
MLSSELERMAARHVPGTGKPEIHRLRNGLMNETYRVLRDGGAYAMRVATTNPYDLGLDRAWEARVLECAIAADLAPRLEFCDPQRGILIVRWVDGRSWTPAELRQKANISRMAELVRRIHALPMPTPARAMSPANWIEYYGAALTRRRADVPAGTSLPTPESPDRSETGNPSGLWGAALQATAVRQLAALAALPSVSPVVCHSDLHTLNLIDRGHSLVLLDWEYAHASDPLWDLAGWSANNDLEDEFKHELLASYTRRPPTRNEYLRLQLLCWLYDCVCLLWSELYLSLHARPAVAVAGEATHWAASDDAAQGGVSARAELIAARLNAPK